MTAPSPNGYLVFTAERKYVFVKEKYFRTLGWSVFTLKEKLTKTSIQSLLIKNQLSKVPMTKKKVLKLRQARWNYGNSLARAPWIQHTSFSSHRTYSLLIRPSKIKTANHIAAGKHTNKKWFTLLWEVNGLGFEHVGGKFDSYRNLEFYMTEKQNLD